MKTAWKKWPTQKALKSLVSALQNRQQGQTNSDSSDTYESFGPVRGGENVRLEKKQINGIYLKSKDLDRVMLKENNKNRKQQKR